MSVFKKQSTKYKNEDALWAHLVKLRANNQCEKCGSRNNLNAHHIFGRRMKSVRWDEANGVALCATHHALSSQFSAHQTPTEFTRWIIKKRGVAWYDKLRIRAYTTRKPDIEGIRMYLNYEIERQIQRINKL